jgi:hypothetical protein
MAGAVLERVVVDQTIEVVHYRSGHFWRSTGTRAIREALDPVLSEAMDPFAQRRIRKVERVRDRLEALACDNGTHGLGTPEHTSLLRLFQEGIYGGEGLVGTVEFESPHSFPLLKKRLRFIAAHRTLLLLSEQSYFDSNFHGAALKYPSCKMK